MVNDQAFGNASKTAASICRRNIGRIGSPGRRCLLERRYSRFVWAKSANIMRGECDAAEASNARSPWNSIYFLPGARQTAILTNAGLNRAPS
jgi:hypothetical protein